MPNISTRAFDRISPRHAVVALVLVCTAACNRDALGSGDACVRSSECRPGLVCVEGACGTNLAGVSNPGIVPMVMEGEEMPAGGSDAAVDGGEPIGGAGAASGAGTMSMPVGGSGGVGAASGSSGSGSGSDAGTLDAAPGFAP